MLSIVRTSHILPQNWYGHCFDGGNYDGGVKFKKQFGLSEKFGVLRAHAGLNGVAACFFCARLVVLNGWFAGTPP